MKIKNIILAMVLSGSVAASTPADYAQHWPVSAQGEGAYALTLNEEVYRIVQQSDLSDLAAFNAAGEALPFGPMPTTYGPMLATWVQAKTFALPIEASKTPDAMRLHIQRNSNGDVSVDANFANQVALEKRSNDWIIDVQEKDKDKALEVLLVELGEQAGDFTAQISVQASQDLQQWQSLTTASIVSLTQDGQKLQRLQVELPGTAARYLRVQTIDAPEALLIRGFKLKQRPFGIVKLPSLQWLQAEFVKKDGRGFVFQLPARVSPEQLNIELKNTNSIAQFAIASRQNEQDYWQPQSSITVFRLRAAGVSLDNESILLQTARVRYWRIETNTDISDTPILKFAYRPEQFLLLTHGAGPYTLAAGSMRAQRDQYPLDVLINQVKQKQDKDWKPTEVSLGKASKVIANLEDIGKPPTDWRSILLWSILLLGAGGVVLMVLKLLAKTPKE